MLKRLYISNFALINEMDVSFPGQLSVITGETGAGKSIFLEALGLALGKRADLAALKNKTKKCIIEAEFDAGSLDLKAFFEENDLDFDPQIILRREISVDGKSRSFLNDSVVGLNALKVLSEKLIDIHSQHQTLLLNQSNFQLELVDAFGGSLALYKTFRAEYRLLLNKQEALRDLKEKETNAKKELDYFQYLFNELEEINIRPGTLKNLEEESAKLENAETIKSNLLSSANAINGGDNNILSLLAGIKQALNGISKFSEHYGQFYERVNSVYIELKELASEMEDAEGTVSGDTATLDEMNTAMDKLNRLMKKHNVISEEELLKIREDLGEKLSQFSSLETGIEKLKKEIEQHTKTCLQHAKELSKLRLRATPLIEKEVKQMLGELSMENAIFKIETVPSTGLSPNGLEQVRYLFSANKGTSVQELQKVASGGELSRLMLSLKALLASKKELPTIIFDEIDTGVSGDVADKIGNILLKMGKNMQVVAITHLAQMASKGLHHLFVYKKDDEDKTVSYIRQLSEEERITEIAKMLSTSNPTESALKNARELLNV